MNYESLSPSLQALYRRVYVMVLNATMIYDATGTKATWKHAAAHEAALEAVRVASSNLYPDLPTLDKLAPLLRAFRDGADRDELKEALSAASANSIAKTLDAKVAGFVQRCPECKEPMAWTKFGADTHKAWHCCSRDCKKSRANILPPTNT